MLIPKDNASDLYEVDAEVKEAIRFIPVEDLAQVLGHALVRPARKSEAAAHAAARVLPVEKPAAKEPAAVM